MPDGATAGWLIILGVLLVAILITFFTGGGRRDEGEQDIEHLDHEARGDEFER